MPGRPAFTRRSLPRTRCCAGCGWPMCWARPAPTRAVCWTPSAGHRKRGKRGTPQNSGRQPGRRQPNAPGSWCRSSSVHWPAGAPRCGCASCPLTTRITRWPFPAFRTCRWCSTAPATRCGSTSRGLWASWAAASPRTTACRRQPISARRWPAAGRSSSAAWPTGWTAPGTGQL